MPLKIAIPISQFWNKNIPLTIQRDKNGGLGYMVALGTRVSLTPYWKNV
jgi:hypothetical protein